MSARFARDEEITSWREDGWVLLDGLIGTDEIDAATADLREVFPTPEQYHADPRARPRSGSVGLRRYANRTCGRPVAQGSVRSNGKARRVPVPRIWRAEPAARAPRDRDFVERAL